jgi:predicted transcriptional regulator of viral defense system
MLSAAGEKIFHARDLANLWLINNQNSLYVTLKRYQDQGLIHRIYKGFYSLVPLEKLDPLQIGAAALHNFCYVSLETVLFNEGYISQKPGYFTFVSSISKRFTIGESSYKSRQLKEMFLYQTAGIKEQNTVKIASPQRAIADMLYFNPYFNFDRKVAWPEIKALQTKIGYPLTPRRYDFALPR